MASIDTVLDGVVAAIATVVTGLDVEAIVYKGWPHPEELDADLAKRVCHISVYPSEAGQKTTSHGTGKSQVVREPVVDLTKVVSADEIAPGDSATITLGGTVNDGVFSILELAGEYVPYKPVLDMNPDQVAIGIYDAVRAWEPLDGKVTVAVTDNVVTITNDTDAKINLAYKIGGTGQYGTIIRTQSGEVQVHVWAYDDQSRQVLSDAVDDHFGEETVLSFADCSGGNLSYVRMAQNDSEIRQGIYRRILFYSVEYSKVRLDEAYQVLVGLASLEE